MQLMHLVVRGWMHLANVDRSFSLSLCTQTVISLAILQGGPQQLGLSVLQVQLEPEQVRTFFSCGDQLWLRFLASSPAARVSSLRWTPKQQLFCHMHESLCLRQSSWAFPKLMSHRGRVSALSMHGGEKHRGWNRCSNVGIQAKFSTQALLPLSIIRLC